MGIHKPDGVTDSERLLNLLCQRSFLSLWTYPNLFRDQGKTSGNSDGKEVCDAIAVFGEHILIFSDKACTFPDSGSLQVDWGRWYRSAVKKSADQLLGAKRWIKQHPDRLFLDRTCTEPFPIQLPPPDCAKFHLIAVARGASDRCRQHYGGGSGSLMVFSPEVERAIVADGQQSPPFSIGAVAPRGEYVHVLDDVTTAIVLRTMDTAPDLIRYLSEKERFVCSDRFSNAAGEEELVAFYMQSWNDAGDLSFIAPDINTGDQQPVLALAEGGWEELTSSATWRTLQDWRQPSYFWDKLINLFAFHTLEGFLYEVDDPSPKYQETLLRFLAAEPRYRRRILSAAALGQLERAPKDEHLHRSARVVFSTKATEPSYVFLVVGSDEGETPQEYRIRRRQLLMQYCPVVKHLHPSSQHIIGLGIEPKDIQQRSEDLIYLDATEWTSDMASHAAELHERLGILKDVHLNQLPAEPRNYLDARLMSDLAEKIAAKKPGRNDPCPCGSGIKFKRCHGSVV